MCKSAILRSGGVRRVLKYVHKGSKHIWYSVVTFTHVVRSWVCLSPLEESHLRYDERGEENEHHLGVHRLVPAMLLVQPDVLQPEEANDRFGGWDLKYGLLNKYARKSGANCQIDISPSSFSLAKGNAHVLHTTSVKFLDFGPACHVQKSANFVPFNFLLLE